MRTKFVVRPHIPRGSGDAEYRIESEDGILLLAVVDPEMAMTDPAGVAERICEKLNTGDEII